MPGNCLNHFPSGTSGSVRSQLDNNPSWAAEMFLTSTRSSKWSRRRGGRFCRRIRGMLFAVKSAMDFFPQSFFFGGIVGISHLLGQFGQLLAGQLTFARQFKSKLEHAGLLCTRQLFDFFNDNGGSHNLIVAANLTSARRKFSVACGIRLNQGKASFSMVGTLIRLADKLGRDIALRCPVAERSVRRRSSAATRRGRRRPDATPISTFQLLFLMNK